MEQKSNIISFQAERNRRKIKKIKNYILRPTFLAILAVIAIYSVLISGYMVDTSQFPAHGISNAKIQLENSNYHYNLKD